VITITHSDIAQFLSCRRQWWWGYAEDRTPPEKEVGALALGSRVHLAILEGHYRHGADPVAVHDTLVHEAYDRLQRAGAPEWEVGQLYDDAIVGRNCVEAYMNWLATDGPDHGYTVDAVEDQVEAPIMDGRVLLRGKIDLRFRNAAGGLVIDDLKTSGRALSLVAPQLERSFQLYVYDWIQSLLTPDVWIVGGEYTVIRKVTKKQHGIPMVERFSIPGFVRNRDSARRQLTAIIEQMITVLNQVGSRSIDELAYTTPQEACMWCAFRHPCTVYMENPAAGEEMLDTLYVRGRHARYDAATRLADGTGTT